MIAERSSASRIEAKAHGVKFGRSPVLTREQIAYARQLIGDGNKPVAFVTELLRVHRSTLYWALADASVVR
ncbi:recombinase family protein [Ciceribacter ferrooxidans]|uniref:recombinase family protein n=1 Tax=Ciceribacter ferrooxidans TaxID=2509717 RepID=UPI00196BA65B|nr:recombinase family protein [Ciceribacter ferrooxidans]